MIVRDPFNACPAMSLTLFKNVHVLDVRAGQLLEDHQVLVEGDTIRELSDRPIATAVAQLRGQAVRVGTED